MEGGAWQATVHGVTKSQTRLNNFTFTFHFHFTVLSTISKLQQQKMFLSHHMQAFQRDTFKIVFWFLQLTCIFQAVERKIFLLFLE